MCRCPQRVLGAEVLLVIEFWLSMQCILFKIIMILLWGLFWWLATTFCFLTIQSSIRVTGEMCSVIPHIAAFCFVRHVRATSKPSARGWLSWRQQDLKINHVLSTILRASDRNQTSYTFGCGAPWWQRHNNALICHRRKMLSSSGAVKEADILGL